MCLETSNEISLVMSLNKEILLFKGAKHDVYSENKHCTTKYYMSKKS